MGVRRRRLRADPCGRTDLCSEHHRQWARGTGAGVGKAAFLTAARGLDRRVRVEEVDLPDLPATARGAHRPAALSAAPAPVGRQQQEQGQGADFAAWLAEQDALPRLRALRGGGLRRTWPTPRWGCAPGTAAATAATGSPGGARAAAELVAPRTSSSGRPVPVELRRRGSRSAAGARRAPAQPWPGQINLRGLRPLVRAEIQWGLFIHTQRARPTRWDLGWIRSLVTTCRAQRRGLADRLRVRRRSAAPTFTGAIAKEILHELRLVYFTPGRGQGRRVPGDRALRGAVPRTAASHFDLTEHPAALAAGPDLGLSRRPAAIAALPAIGRRLRRHTPGRHRAGRLPGPRRPRRRPRPGRAARRAHAAGSSPTSGTANATGCRRWRSNDPAGRRASSPRPPGRWCSTPSASCCATRWTPATADRLGLDREFIIAVPTAGATTGRTARRPFPDEVARALADEANLRHLAEIHDPPDRGLRDIWETTVITGRRIGEVLKLRWDCLGRYGGLPMFWHDQTKVGNYDAAIRIPERLHDVLAERQRKTLDRFAARHGRPARRRRTRRAGVVPHDLPQPRRHGRH